MLQLGPLAFASPWLLLALATLPVLWWLLRVTPPSPRLIDFPPVRLLLALRPQEETPARTPLWLILLRMLLALLVILAVAGPLLNPGAQLRGGGPLVLVIDDGWGAAADWPARMEAVTALIDQAERESRPVRILTTARNQADKTPVLSDLMTAAEARRVARAIQPKPWAVDRRGAVEKIERAPDQSGAHVAWISDGLGDDYVDDFTGRLRLLGAVQVYAQPADATARLIRPPEIEGDKLIVTVLRAGGQRGAEEWLRAAAEDGRVLARQRIRFEPGQTEAKVTLELPGEVRNAMTRLQIEGQATAGGVFLVDERWRRRPVGLVSGEISEEAQPLLSSLYYLERSLKPYSEVRRGSIAQLLERELAVLVLADIGRLTDTQREQVTSWMARGGVVLRFAGPKLAKTSDDLIPVRIRGGGRALGGAMSWAKPAELKSFDENSPFAEIPVASDVRINRQVLAEPSLDLNKKTWARLSDGTPLVTAEKRGQGWLILVHTTANTDWSNLPLSGLFVTMLRRIVALSQGVVSEESSAVFAPIEILDGFGNVGAPPANATPIPARGFRDAAAGPKTPPGYYGREGARRALNLSARIAALEPLKQLPPGIERIAYGGTSAVEFKPWLLLAAMLLALADLGISFVLRGVAIGRRGGAAAGVATASMFALVVMAATLPVNAQQTKPPPDRAGPAMSERDEFALRATRETRIAFVESGDAALDRISHAGLRGLSRVLRRRTAVEPGDPMGVNVERDELSFFPLLYWSVSPQQRALSDDAIAKLKAYLGSGGTILFDTRERSSVMSGMLGGGTASRRLRFLLNRLDIPSLIHTPKDHVLTKAFYLLTDFPGRWTGGTVWVERRGGRHNDGVSSVVIGSNDWAGAWAIDEAGRPMFPVVPGTALQREMAYRFGVNWVMYGLTGNYKTDQVHVPAIIERLGQ